jgi:hypothetical protein
VVPVNPYTEILKVEQLSGGFAGGSTVKTLIYDKTEGIKYGPVNVELEKGIEQLYFKVTSRAQNGTESPVDVYYLTLTRHDANVNVETLFANEIQGVPDEDNFNVNIADNVMTVDITTENRPATVVTRFRDFDAEQEPNEADKNNGSANYTTQYYVPDSVAEGQSVLVPFEVVDTSFYISDEVTPNARKIYNMAIFRSTHETAIGRIIVIDPATYEIVYVLAI